MNILLIIDHLDSGGAQRQIVTLARGLAARGHDVSCFYYYANLDHHRPALDEAGVRLHGVDKSSRFSLRVPLALRRLIKENRFDVALSYLTTPNVYNALASMGTGTKTVVSERCLLLPELDTFGMRLKFQLYRLADRIVVNAAHVGVSLREADPWMAPKLVTIHNGLDLERFRPRTRGDADTRSGLNLVAIGGVHERKNAIGLIEALRLHRERFGWTPTVRWVGRKGTLEVDVLAYKQAETLLDRYGLRPNWRWLGVRRDIPEILQEADALIHPSFFEGLPNVVCEALASGLPVLAARVADNPWLVGRGVRGLLFDPSDPTDIVRAIEQFSSMDKAAVDEMRRQARSFAEAELSVDRLVLQYEQLFEDLVRS